MSQLRIETLTMPGADLGPENPLPPLQAGRDLHLQDLPSDIPEDMRRNLTYGRVPNVLPYTLQDGYTRALRPRDFRCAVLENDVLRATFLLTLGGRLWSLWHKPSQRELLDVNPVFQPANLALRNAWFSGGVEWNIGTTGHSPFTCAPLFAARVTAPDGTPVLRLYEWERIRQVPFQIDAYLPDGSEVLFVRVRILNPHDRTVPMYWWSNIAVPETPQTRVVVPAETAYSFGYGGGGLRRVPVPSIEGVDVTYPTQIPRAADFFFHVPDGVRPWIAALDGQGRGLVQTSTARLKGRKLFVWGMGPGGRRWQTFLAEPGHAYLEIQAGLARTQLEHVPMPAGAEWAWMEAYGLLEADPAAVHGPDWAEARATVAAELARRVPGAALDAALARSMAWADRPPDALIQRGSGWGALERRRREIAGEGPMCGPGMIFDDAALGAAQAPWLALLEQGTWPVHDPAQPPRAYMVQAQWRDRLEDAVAAGEGDWLAWLHLGVMRYNAAAYAGAREAWARSLEATPTPWALHNRAVLARAAGDADHVAELCTRALRMRPDLLPLAVACGRALIEVGRPEVWLDRLDDLSAAVRAMGRVRLLEGQAALAAGDLDRVAGLFDGSLVIDDLREGERSLSHLWVEYHARRLAAEEGVPLDDALRARARREHPVPPTLDFRMSGAD